jgi:putative ABC transport system substrate-binding protein
LLPLARQVLLFLTACLMAFHCAVATARADATTIGVVYPEVREPFRSVFESIIAGIEQQAGSRVARFPLDESVEPQLINDWATRNRIDAVIALGRRSHALTRPLAQIKPVTTGAVRMSPDLDKGTGIVLNPDPKVVFAKLRQFEPKVKRIVVIYNPKKNAWLIRRAEKAAKDLKITLDARAVSDVRQSARLYRDILKRQSGTQHAVWLLNDKSVFDTKAIFPIVLQEAWNRNFLVFSNNPAHVKRGVLFAMYPDNAKMGQSLAKLALKTAKAGSKKTNTMLPLRDLLIAFNVRTAEHLGLDVDRKQRDEFDLVFPPQ